MWRCLPEERKARYSCARPNATFGLSPRDAAGFITALEERRKTALELEDDDRQDLPEHHAYTVRTGLAAWGAPLWSDRLERTLLLVGLVLNVLFFGYMSLVYSALPSRLALHWDAQAQVDRIGDPLELVRLPAFALAVWLINAVLAWWAYRRERAISLFLLAGAVAAQVVFWAGALSIVLRAR